MTNTEELLQEAALMAQFNASHIVGLIGVVTSNQQCQVILQFCDRGSLQQLLRDDKLNEGQGCIPTTAVLKIAAEIADGMAYLEEKRFVHRDLAARNILVGADNTCLVAVSTLTITYISYRVARPVSPHTSTTRPACAHA